MQMDESLEAERALLCALMIDQDAFDVAIEQGLVCEDFYLPAHATLFKAIYELHAESKLINPSEIYDKLSSMGKIGSVGGAVFIAGLYELLPTSAHARSYARLVHERGVRNRLASTALKILESAEDEDTAFNDLINHAESSILAVSEDAYKSGSVPIFTLVTEAQKRVNSMIHGEMPLKGIASGFLGFDALTGGLQPGELIILAARPSMGKTAFALNIATNVGVWAKIPVGFFSIEMNAQSLLERMISSESGVDMGQIKNAKVSPKDCSKLITALGNMGEGAMFIDESPQLSITQMRAKCRRMVRQNGVKLIIVDYLQLMSGSRHFESKVYEVAEISRGLKGIARELNVPVLALAQLNRGVESRADKRPLMSDLRDSGSVEQDADVVAFLYREEYYLREKTPDYKKGTAECIIAKNRNGSTGSFHMNFAGHLTKFSSIAEHE